MVQEKENPIITDILRIQERCAVLFEELQPGKDINLQRLQFDFTQIFRLDIDELKRIQEDLGDEELIEHCRGIFYAVRNAIRGLEGNKKITQQEARELVRKILLVENHDLIKVTNYERFEPAVQKEFFRLLEMPQISSRDVEVFLVKIRGHISPKVFKKIQNTLKKKKRKEEQQWDQGPIGEPLELAYITRRLSEFFSSPYARDFPSKEKIDIYLCGSLVTGFCTNPRSPFYQKPTDYERLSDVDIVVLVSSQLWTEVTRHMTGKQLVRVGGVPRTMPVGLDTHPGPESTGPFAGLFPFLRGLSIGRRQDRPVHLIFMMNTLINKFQIQKEPHKHLGTFITI